MGENVVVFPQTGVGMSFEGKKVIVQEKARERRALNNVKVQGNHEHTPIFDNVELPSGMVVMHKDSHRNLHKQNLKDVLGKSEGSLKSLGTPSTNSGSVMVFNGKE